MALFNTKMFIDIFLIIYLFKDAILVSGGWGDQRSVEMFIPLHGKTCTLPDLPDDRNGHTMDVYTYADSEGKFKTHVYILKRNSRLPL